MKQGWKRAAAWLPLLCLVSGAGLAGDAVRPGSPAAVRKTVEGTMLVTGAIDVDAQGQVSRFTLAGRDTLPPEIAQMIEAAAPAWKFLPLQADGKPVASESNFSMRLVARNVDGQYVASMASANFWARDEEDAGLEVARHSRMPPPRYPEAAMREGIKGVVYLVLKLDGEGNVEDAIAEQVNLTVVGSEQQMKSGRAALEGAALVAARRWKIDASGLPQPSPGAPSMVRVPVQFLFPGEVAVRPGKWEAYVPGPRQWAPWMGSGPDKASGGDAVIPGHIFVAGTGPELLTPLGEG